MYKSTSSDIKQYHLDTTLHTFHKDGIAKSDFGMDNTSELLEGGFGIYSSANTKTSIGPIKSVYYRIGLIRAGSAEVTIGLETFHPVRDTIIIGIPGQVFSLQQPTDDFFVYYMLFSESFIAETLILKKIRDQFPFLDYSGIQCFPLSEEEGAEIESMYYKINDEIKARKVNAGEAVRLYIQLIYITAGRSYNHEMLSKQGSGTSGISLYTRYLKLVSEHFLSVQKVADYADMLHISADHLNRTIKAYSDKTAHELIDEMILREGKAYLLYSELSIAEIAYKLGFNDPSHFNRFFKKLTDRTPLQYRNKSE